MVISVSRRSDIPRFAFGWFLERLEEGFAEVKNPFNARQTRRVSLLPPGSPARNQDSADVFAFWTRDPSAILEHSDDLEKRGFTFFVMTTLTAYPALLEPNAPPAEEVITTMTKLSRKIGAERVIWRYDPVFLSSVTDFEFHRRGFARLAERLSGAVNRVIVSVYDEYAGAEKRLAALEKARLLERVPHYAPAAGTCGKTGGFGTRPEPVEQKRLRAPVRLLLADLAKIARNEGMEIQSCAEEDLSAYGIKSGACIDGGYLEREFGYTQSGKDKNQRPLCRCVQSADIGSYGSCPAGCAYCYANSAG